MFEALLKALTGEDETPLPEPDARLALAALLVRLARTDGHYEASEIARIDVILGRRYALSDADAAKLRAKLPTYLLQAIQQVTTQPLQPVSAPAADGDSDA